MTIDEAIKYCEEVVKANTDGVYDAIALGGINISQEEIDECNKCAEEYRQFMAWLKELKECRMKTINQEWIPMSVRPPDEYGEYLTTDRSGVVKIETFTLCKQKDWPYEYVDDWFDNYNSSWPEASLKRYENEIIAWMPKPESYKELKNNETD